MKVVLIATLLALATCFSMKAKLPWMAPSVPIWPEQFSFEFEEASQLIVMGITEGTYYYDYTNQRHAIYRFNGRYDRFCGTVYKNQETPCRHIVSQGTFFIT